jgi:hypothetical protein
VIDATRGDATWRQRVGPAQAVHVHVRAHISLTGLDLLATSIAAFAGGWLLGYLSAAT